MDCIRSASLSRILLAAAVASVLVSMGGCAGLIANLLYPGHIVEPLYDGLEGKRVAVVCGSDLGTFGPSPATQMLPKKVADLLRRHVKNIQVIDQQEIEKWTDSNDWIDYKEIGKGVEADMVVGIDLASFRLRDGATLWKGRADLTVAVYDMSAGGKQAWSTDPIPVVYPKTAGYHTTSTSEAEFRQEFVAVLAREVAKNFYAYDLKEDIASDRPARLGS